MLLSVCIIIYRYVSLAKDCIAFGKSGFRAVICQLPTSMLTTIGTNKTQICRTDTSTGAATSASWQRRAAVTSCLKDKDGNLLPFARAGLEVTGIDIARVRISQARDFFAKAQTEGKFVCQDIFRLQPGEKFSIIICHDVVEHVADKAHLLALVNSLMEEDGVAFVSFPAWQMPSMT